MIQGILNPPLNSINVVIDYQHSQIIIVNIFF